MEDIRIELQSANQSLRRKDADRAKQMEYRDDVILRAIESKVSWSQVQELTGLTPRGVQQALRRAREFRAKV